MKFFLLVTELLSFLSQELPASGHSLREEKIFPTNFIGFYAWHKPSIRFSIVVELTFVNIISVFLK